MYMNYETGAIYKIVCKDLNIKDLYVGSTSRFENRIHHHISVCNNPLSKAYNYHVYDFIRQNGGFENWQILLVEYYPCNDRHELQKREREVMEQLNATLNVRKAIITPEEVKIYSEKYYKDNKDTYKAHNKNYYESHKEVYKTKYYNKDKAKEKYTKEKQAEPKIICECGSEFIKTCKTAHSRTKKHQGYLNITCNGIVEPVV
jgi:hypothetical protein